jgi:hypothetical protein
MIGKQKLQALHGIIALLLVDLGVDTHNFANDDFEILADDAESFKQQLEAFSQKNKEVLEHTATMETVTLSAIGI